MNPRSLLRRIFAIALALGLSAAVAAPIRFDSNLTGAAELPPTGSPGTGFVVVDLDPALNTLRVTATFSGLLAPTAASHIHCCTPLPATGNAGVATTVPTFPGFPLGVTAGTWISNVFDLRDAGSYNPAFIAANGGTTASAEAALVAGMLAGDSYFNIHTALFPAGEVRGFLVPVAAVPEPWTTGLVGLGLAAGWAARRRRPRG